MKKLIKKQRKTDQEEAKKGREKSWLAFLIIGIVGIIGGVSCFVYTFLRPQEEIAALTFPEIPSQKTKEVAYSNLTGMPLADASLAQAPTYCIQVPNGTDGARPQAGLTEAGVIFEAIAEAGITRFAAIFQNPTSAVIGPIRSLRLYYLEWDTPFDCTIVHAGGADDALRAVSAGGYRDLTESYAYMYRGTYGVRQWNNLFTTPANLKQFNADRGYNSSDVKGFARMTPEESNRARVNDLANEKLSITTPAVGNTSDLEAKVSNIAIRFGGSATFNVSYTYDTKSNTYKRSYGIGEHEVYSCPDENLGERNPEDVCSLTTMAPSVVVAMIVSERKASDNYHEDITTLGSGNAYIFQKGNVIRGTWNKPTRADQIKFLDSDGEEIKLAPGQTFVSAVPTYGGVDY